MSSRAGISTSYFSKAYIAVAWGTRNELQESERRGFSQFFYLAICGHIESILSSIIKARVFSIRHMFRWEALPPQEYHEEDTIYHCDQKPIVESLWKIILLVAHDTENAPLSKLIELYNKTFQENLREIIGKELYEDLDALASLRNLFGHGRDIFVEFDDPFGEGKANLDKNPLQKPAKRLHHAGIIKNFDITMQNYIEFHASFYSDDALLYFYKAIQKVEDKLANSLEFPPEKARIFFVRLPDLEV